MVEIFGAREEMEGNIFSCVPEKFLFSQRSYYITIIKDASYSVIMSD
jgi:hypothetical protein